MFPKRKNLLVRAYRFISTAVIFAFVVSFFPAGIPINFASAGVNPLAGTTQTATFSTSGTWNVPNGISSFTVKLLGAGGKGGDGGVSQVYAGYNGPGGGGAGVYVEKVFSAVIGANYNFLIGDKTVNDGATVFKTADGGILIGATAGGDGSNGANGTVVGNGGSGGVGGVSLPGTLPDLVIAGPNGSAGPQGTYIYGCSDGFSQPGNGGSGGSSNIGVGGSGGLAPSCGYTYGGSVGSVGSGGGGGSGYSGLGALGGKGQVIITYTYPVAVVDTTAPTIILLGANPIYVSKGDTFIDPGSTVADNIDVGLIAIVSGSVNTAIVETYTLTYTATDTAGNVGTATRTVIVYDPLAGIFCPTTGTLPTVAVIGTQTVLAWPSTDTTSILQSSTDLATWTNITNTQVIVNGCNTVALPTPVTTTFYQLVPPPAGGVTPTVSFTITPSATSGSGNAGAACVYLNAYIGKGRENISSEVRKLQTFLIDYESTDVPVNGIFGDETELAVKAFQTKYSADVLQPWGTTTPTGYVYITTSKKINDIYCASIHSDYKPGAMPELIPDVTIPTGVGSQIGLIEMGTSLAVSTSSLWSLVFNGSTTTETLTSSSLALGPPASATTTDVSPPRGFMSNTASVFNSIAINIYEAITAMWRKVFR